MKNNHVVLVFQKNGTGIEKVKELSSLIGRDLATYFYKDHVATILYPDGSFENFLDAKTARNVAKTNYETINEVYVRGDRKTPNSVIETLIEWKKIIENGYIPQESKQKEVVVENKTEQKKVDQKVEKKEAPIVQYSDKNGKEQFLTLTELTLLKLLFDVTKELQKNENLKGIALNIETRMIGPVNAELPFSIDEIEEIIQTFEV